MFDVDYVHLMKYIQVLDIVNKFNFRGIPQSVEKQRASDFLHCGYDIMTAAFISETWNQEFILKRLWQQF